MYGKSQFNRREGQAAIPSKLDQMLSFDQIQTLHRVENFGWELQFVRRPLFQPAQPVLKHHDSARVALIDEEGGFEIDPAIELRH